VSDQYTLLNKDMPHCVIILIFRPTINKQQLNYKIKKAIIFSTSKHISQFITGNKTATLDKVNRKLRRQTVHECS